MKALSLALLAVFFMLATIFPPAAFAEPVVTGAGTNAAETAPPPVANQTPAKPPAANEVVVGNDRVYKESLGALTMLFVLAVLLENALAVIFNWRVFLAFFSLKGVKTIVMVIIALIVVNSFDIDVVASLVAAYKSKPDLPAPLHSSAVSIFLTALIIAGGSAGVNNIMAALGYRTNKREEELIQRPPKNQAWVAVRVKNVTGATDIVVQIAKVGASDPRVVGLKPIAGTVGGEKATLRGLLLRDPNRFPQNGGYTLDTNTAYEISIAAKDSQGRAITALGDVYLFGDGAIVDFTAKI